MKRTAKKITKRRMVIVMTAFMLFAVYLITAVFRLCFLEYEYYRQKTLEQITTTSALRAERGKIYDSNMNLLATNKTVYRIFVSSKDIKSKSKKDGIDYAAIISEGLAPILSLDNESLYKKIKDAKVLDVTLKNSASTEEYLDVLDFADSNNIEKLIFTEAQSSRYYPEGTFAAHTVGFTGSDNQGLYGLEYYYDDVLKGRDGYYVYAKDASGNALDTEYSEYFPAENGCNIITTLDGYLQKELEAVIETVRVNHDVQNRVTGVVMDTESGAILAMATTTPFDPNTPFTLDSASAAKLESSGLTVGSEEYKKYKNELLSIMWSNKAISETYEPGSTFKIVTVSAALDSGVATPEDTFSCKGYYEVGGWRIKCHKVTGHGSGFNLAYGLQMSCNPCMMALSERIGASTFYSYFKKFGYLEKTGIDLPSEAGSIFHKEEALGSTELATASFGQRFKVSVIGHLTAIAAVANGGRLVQPYLVEKIIDTNGNTVSKHETVVKRQVISEDVAKTVSKILIDGVNGDGGAKNAGVGGYDIAAKTGTSQKFDILDENGNSYLRISSTVAYAIDDENSIAVIIIADEPNSQVKYGSVVAAPYVSMFMEKALPYLEYSSKNETSDVEVESYRGMPTAEAKKRLENLGLSYEIIGGGELVLSQVPEAGTVTSLPLSKIILYTQSEPEEYATVPKLTGLSVSDAIRRAVNCGLNIKFSGSASTPDRSDEIIEQSLPEGSRVKKGSVIILRTINKEFED